MLHQLRKEASKNFSHDSLYADKAFQSISKNVRYTLVFLNWQFKKKIKSKIRWSLNLTAAHY